MYTSFIDSNYSNLQRPHTFFSYFSGAGGEYFNGTVSAWFLPLFYLELNPPSELQNNKL